MYVGERTTEIDISTILLCRNRARSSMAPRPISTPTSHSPCQGGHQLHPPQSLLRVARARSAGRTYHALSHA